MKLLFFCLIAYFYARLVSFIIHKQYQIINQTFHDCRKKTMNISNSFIVFLSAFLLLLSLYIKDGMNQFIFYHIALICLILAIIDYYTFYILDRTLALLCLFIMSYLCYHDLWSYARVVHCGMQIVLFYGLTRMIKQGLGGGDVKFCILASLALSPQSYYAMLLIAIHLAFLDYFIRYVKKQEFKQTYIAFGPYLALSFLCIFFIHM